MHRFIRLALLVLPALASGIALPTAAHAQRGGGRPVRSAATPRPRSTPAAALRALRAAPRRTASSARRVPVLHPQVADTALNLIPRGTRQPIAFQPFAMVHPRDGHPLNPNAQLRLPNGQVTTVGVFYAQLNQVEHDLNSRGFSLRQGRRLYGRRANGGIRYSLNAPWPRRSRPHARCRWRGRRGTAASSARRRAWAGARAHAGRPRRSRCTWPA